MSEPKKREPTAKERVAGEVARQRQIDRPERATVKVSVERTGATNKVKMEAKHSDEIISSLMVQDTFASSSIGFITQQLLHICNVTAPAGGVATEDSLNAALALIGAVEPRNELEAALAVQMAATHEISLSLATRAKNAQTVEGIREYGNLATKMARTFAAQIKALSDMRRGGEQIIRHVHVHDGGQAVVAETVNVNRGGSDGKSPDQSDAYIPTLLGADPFGNGVPVPRREREEALQDARRD